MRFRIACVAVLTISASIQGCGDSGQASDSSSTSGSAGTSATGGGTPPAPNPAPTAASLPAAALSCSSAQISANSGQGSGPSLDVELSGNDPTQTFTSGSAFTIHFAVAAAGDDELKWQISDYAGTPVAGGSFSAATGSTTADLTCSSTLAGYFEVSAQLQNAGTSISHKGSRPHGFVSFGVLPNVADLLPAAQSGPLDRHSFGLQGSNFVASGGNGLQPINEHLGSTWVLDSRSQTNVEPDNAGQYNPATYPLNVGFKQGSIARIVTLNGIPPWASTSPSAAAALTGSYPPKSFSAYQAFTALVGQESARVQSEYIPDQQKNYYQVTWEPDPGPNTQWKGTDSQFVQLYKAAWNGVHSTDPNAAVMGPTTTNLEACADWLNRLAPLGYTKYLDAVSCHGYYTVGASSSLPPEPADLPGQMRSMRAALTNLMPSGTKLFVTETGISYPMGSHYSPGYPTADVLTQHAEAVVRTHLILLGEGADTSFLFYSADYSYEVGFGLYFNLSMPNPDFGSPDVSPKPAAMAVAAATRLIDGSRSLGAITDMPSGSYGYSFVLSDKAHAVTALWAHSGSFDASAPYQLQIDASGTNGTAVVLDAMGNPRNVQYTNGVLNLTLSEMPVYVLSSNIAVLQSTLRAPQGYASGI